MKNIRLKFQLVFTIITNSYIYGFFNTNIYKGTLKSTCVPGLNCYSCPSALGACPIGSMQSSLAKANTTFPYYILGTLMLFGSLFGRLVCGFMCPFGLVQDLLHKIKSYKIELPVKIDKILRYVKYFILVEFVVILPITLTNQFGIGSPTFCKYICPSGTLFGGIPLVALDEGLRNIIGSLFFLKVTILIIVLISSIFIYRPFCKYICPLGAFYGLFNKFSLYKMKIDKAKCIDCKKCERVCKMNIEVTKDINSNECIRCNECKVNCPTKCIK